MKPTASEWLVRLAGWCLGGVFVYAGVLKVTDPWAFADSVASFRLLPAVLINPVALILPVLEIILGVALIAGVKRSVGAGMLGVLCVLFAAALGQALVRGIEVDCGCFGGGAPSTARTVWALLRDIGLGLLAWWVWHRGRRAANEPVA
ncbi:MAG: Methylamine utilization protein [Rariglobus sp.]|jgi:uncharacterized membrane protein YphA (DoxX/SURF4 family)|nr:Methylamine utilization protein [Rariglobus sp.]